MRFPEPHTYVPRPLSCPLAGAVTRLYEVFGNYRLTSYVGTASPEELRRLLQSPVLMLGEEEFGWAVADLSYGWTDHDDFLSFSQNVKFLLPRAVETDLVSENYDSILRLLLHARTTEFSNWPIAERRVVSDFLWTWWNFTLEQPVTLNHFFVESTLCAVAQLEDDLSPYLEQWQEDESLLADLHTLDLVRYLWDDETQNLALNNSWEERPSQAEQVRAWLVRPECLARLQRAYALLSDEVYRTELERVIAHLQQLQG